MERYHKKNKLLSALLTTAIFRGQLKKLSYNKLHLINSIYCIEISEDTYKHNNDPN